MTRHRSPRRRSTAVMLSVVLAVVALVSCSSGSGTGSPLDVTITAADGGTATLGDLVGRPVVVNMWATWCGPCVAEMPVFEEVAGSTDSVAVIGVNVGDTAVEALDFARGLGITYPIYTDPDGVLSTSLGVDGLPATAFVDADGSVVELHQGAYTRSGLDAAIAAAFSGARP